MADAGLFPAIDIDASVSRSMNAIVSEQQLLAARQVKHLYSTFQQNRDLINIGAYQQGSDDSIDRAIQAAPAIRHFLSQQESAKVDMQSSLQALSSLGEFSASSANQQAGGVN